MPHGSIYGAEISYLALDELIKNNATRDKFFEQPQIYPLFVGNVDGNGIVQRIKDVLSVPFTLRLSHPGGKRPPPYAFLPGC